eukprot:NODE_1418_length_1110_cov_0.368942.p1 type:complete len:141 gc:universal NODE_1418_length_1110_cov_0.368942:902-480(-)
MFTNLNPSVANKPHTTTQTIPEIIQYSPTPSFSYFTDASIKLNQNHIGIGIGTVPPDSKRSECRFQFRFTNFTEDVTPCSTEIELYGIKMCLREALYQPEFNDFTIYCDNGSSLRICQNIWDNYDPSKSSLSHIVIKELY